MAGDGMKAVLFKSPGRFSAFRNKLNHYGVECTVLDFDRHDWLDFDYGQIDFAIYYPSFEYSSSHPLALGKVRDNLLHIHALHRDLEMYPDPKIIRFYNDKYRQFLFLRSRGYPVPPTVPLLSLESLDLAGQELGYPMVVKNRYGAGGGSVFQVRGRRDLERYYRLSTLDLWNLGSLRHLLGMTGNRLFLYHLIKERRMPYPFLSPPLLAQKFIQHDRDLKTVVGSGKVVEAHWRMKADQGMWKVNIDAGGIGIWGRVPEEAIELSERLARDLEASWINLDLMVGGGRFLISEFSPVWHHYAYREKPTFRYEDDYNIDTPIEIALDLERIIVESLIRACERRRGGAFA